MNAKSAPKMGRFVANIGLLLSGSAMALSGLLLQGTYHIGHHGNTDKRRLVLGMDYWDWSNTHVVATLLVSCLMFIHVVWHWKFYEAVVRNRLFAKNRQIVTLTIVFAIAALTGYTPLFVRLGGGSEVTRKAIIEVHDKVALVLFVYLIVHIRKSFRWFVSSYRELRKFTVPSTRADETEGTSERV